ncbi:MAG: hypothetical protein ABEJ07_05465 [Candidatus Nanohaloarchaea archaeon]
MPEEGTREVVNHFFGESGEEVEILELDSEVREEYVEYLLENDMVTLRSANPNMLNHPNSRAGNMVSLKRDRAERRADMTIESDDTYFVFYDPEWERVVGRAANIEEGGATEMRIRIDDEKFRGLRDSSGTSLYDTANWVRIHAAEGTPYVMNTSEKAQYKFENANFGNREFEILKWEPHFKSELNPGVLMALQEPVGEAPRVLYIPETEDGSYEEFVESRLESFHEDVETELSGGEVFSGRGRLEVWRPTGRHRSSRLHISGGGSFTPSEAVEKVYDIIDSEGVAQVNIDAEVSESPYVSERLLDDGWHMNGFVPAIGGNYGSYEVSLVRPFDAKEQYVTEGFAGFLDEMGIPYSIDEGDFETRKSLPAEIGVDEGEEAY